MSGYFLSDEAYQNLYRAATGTDRAEYVENLEIEIGNLRNALNSAHSVACNLAYDLGNA